MEMARDQTTMTTTIRHNFGDLFSTGFDDGSAFAVDPDFASSPLIEATGSTTLAGHVGSTAEQMALYLTAPGDTGPISVGDLFQGQLGDCFLISAIGEIARVDPSFISGMIQQNANDTETVTLYEAKNGSLAWFGDTQFKTVAETVTNNFSSLSVDNGSTQDVVNGVKEIWPQVLESAYAQLNGGLSAIADGGYPVVALETLTGQAANYYAPASVSLATLEGWSSANDLIVLDTRASGDATYNLVGSHAYMFLGLETVKGVAYVQAGNPWGFDQPSLIPVSQLNAAFGEIDVGKV
jgi:hypothetical protein